VKIADDEGVSASSSVIIRVEFLIICFSSRVMYNIFSKTATNEKKKGKSYLFTPVG
jgi:hypothetical protein